MLKMLLTIYDVTEFVSIYVKHFVFSKCYMHVFLGNKYLIIIILKAFALVLLIKFVLEENNRIKYDFWDCIFKSKYTTGTD